MKLIKIINILLLYYVFVATGALINYYYFIKHLGYFFIDLTNVPWIFILSNLIIFFVVLTYSFILYKLTNQKKFIDIFNLNSKSFSKNYLIATYLSIFTSFSLLFNKALYDESLKLDTIVASAIFIFTSIIFMFTNYQIISKSKENRELKVFVDTISMLNKKLEQELIQRKKIEQKLKLYAHTDTMTRVYNRATGLDILDEFTIKARENNKSIILFYVDINNLKIVNDTYGHNEGDNLIITIAEILKSYIYKPDIVCRLGGDEFLMVLYDKNLAKAHSLWEKINNELNYLNKQSKKLYRYSVSRGIVEYSPNLHGDISIKDLIVKADNEMYKHKKGIY
jgi:diguanylate cyclase (GGDEF)-like protein